MARASQHVLRYVLFGFGFALLAFGVIIATPFQNDLPLTELADIFAVQSLEGSPAKTFGYENGVFSHQ